MVRMKWRTFFGAPVCLNLDELNADVAVVGVPFSHTLHWSGTTAYGPDAVRDTNAYYYYDGMSDTDPPAAGYYDFDTDRMYLKGVTMADCGDVPQLFHNFEQNFSLIGDVIRRILDRGAFPVIVGGDHSISAPVCKAFDRYNPLDVVHFDADTDFRDSQGGERYSSGTPIRRISEFPFVRNITSIGIRRGKRLTPSVVQAQRKRVTLITAKRFRELGPEEAISLVPEAEHIYVTLDTDVLDVPYAPGTRAPGMGGLSYVETSKALQELTKRGKIVGLDVVEVAPAREANVTPIVAAQLIVDLLSVLFPSKA